MTTISPSSGAGLRPSRTWAFAGSPEWRQSVALPEPGEQLGEFELLEVIGRGGAGIIFKARQHGPHDRFAAVKVIQPAHLASRDVVRRFRKESRSLTLMRHPNVVEYFHADLDAATPYLATEFVPGTDLRRLVNRDGPVGIAEALNYAVQAATGLQHAHEHGLVHRDISPANLVVTPEGIVKVIDFGLVSTTDPTDSRFPFEVHDLTRLSTFLGTPSFISPEQGRNSRAADARSDVYSLGCTLYYLLTGTVPFVACSTIDMICRKATEPPPAPSAAHPWIPGELDLLLLRMMACNPVHRPQTMTEVIGALTQTKRLLF